MLLRTIIVLTLFSNYLVNADTNRNEKKSLYGHANPVPGSPKTVIFDAETKTGAGSRRQKRDINVKPSNLESNITVKVNHLNDTHKQLLIHWVGEGSSVILCLARDPDPIPSSSPVRPSAVYISYDYGDTYENKTEFFKLPSGNYATVERFYYSKYNTHFVFTDVRNKQIFVTSNHGRNITRIEVDFSPSEVTFKESNPEHILILDKNDPERKIWISQDFGQTFMVFEQHVKSFFWVDDNFVTQNFEPSNLSRVLYTEDLSIPVSTKINQKSVYALNVVDLYQKGDYIFSTNKTSNDNYNLFVSYKLGSKIQCVFDTKLDLKAYQIIDVSDNRAFVSVCHTDFISHLYVSESLTGPKNTIHFTPSLKNVLSYFPNISWQDTPLQYISEEAFTDLYKVEGLNGIYIASQVTYHSPKFSPEPRHLITKITFDHGSSWRNITPPHQDSKGQSISCSPENNCSLHLCQRFSQLYPDTRTTSILSRKSAPGILIATGVIGKSLRGSSGVYISTDAGVTWKEGLKNLYMFNMANYGGILTAAKYFKNREATRNILYSADGGEKWLETPFHEDKIFLYGLFTEPRETTTIFTMFGSLPGRHQWIIFKLDMNKVFNYNCSEDDYEFWSPNKIKEPTGGDRLIPCSLGRQITFKRRIPHSNCYNNLDLNIFKLEEPCNCDDFDYECDFGFTKIEGSCIRNKNALENPYKIPSNCKPGEHYNRTKGYRKVTGDVCVDGFQKHYNPDFIPCPSKSMQTFLLFAVKDKIVRLDLISKEKQDLPLMGIKNVIAIDFDMRNNCVYWSDSTKRQIKRQCLDGDSADETLVSSELSLVEGMSFDWISNNLYFVDATRAVIEIIRTDVPYRKHMRKIILQSPVLKKPRGIAVHPVAGYFFWTDWDTDNPSVSRANLDGSEFMSLFRKPIVVWPNGITIDHIAERIYWVDARLDYIGSSDLQGKKFKNVISKSNYIRHPFAIAVFKDTMYWDDWSQNAILSADKDHGSDVVKLTAGDFTLKDLKIYAHSIQEGTNACVNATCPYFCVGQPEKGGHMCLCPNGTTFSSSGKCLCPGGIEPNSNMTCPEIQNSCKPDYFSCGNGICISQTLLCDGDNDCDNGDDEEGCCGPNYFTCRDLKCVPLYWRCDFDKDCPDGSDEDNCSGRNCTSSEFACANGKCISQRWKCDGENDCSDESDEKNCASCKLTEFKCADKNTCIPLSWKCDGTNDCNDGTDEINCPICSANEFKCVSGNTSCIPLKFQCNGEVDCRDGSDEKNCPIACKKGEFKCAEGKTCIPHHWKCDGDFDCNDESDEKNCSIACKGNEFKCADGRISCIPVHQKCDGKFDCSDRSDEKNCSIACKSNEFKCAGGRTSCIPFSWKCDGYNDCEDGSDEKNCSIVCKSNEFKCTDSGTCLPLQWRCDGNIDCNDQSDELNCNSTICDENQFQCKGSPRICISKQFQCDGEINCYDGSDELDCGKPLTTTPANNSTCLDWMFKCNNNKCIPYWWKCDGAFDCEDRSDEIGCFSTVSPPTSTTTKYIQLQCDNGKCINSTRVCNTSDDCNDYKTDSKNFTLCLTDQFKCHSGGSCVPLKDVCNNRSDCPDGSDEISCTAPDEPATRSCPTGFFRCDLNKCYPLAVRCNGSPNCKDGFDEKNCSGPDNRYYQVLKMGIDEMETNESSLLLYWWILKPDEFELEFLPSISEVEHVQWKNKTWTTRSEFRFTDLKPYTRYNMTVYVRVNGTRKIFSPAKFYQDRTAEGIPSEPYDVSVQQQNGSHILVTWNKPMHPNGIIQNYEICWYPPSPPTKLKLNDDRTTYLLNANFEPDVQYSFYVIAHNGKHESKTSQVQTIRIKTSTEIDMNRNLVPPV